MNIFPYWKKIKESQVTCSGPQQQYKYKQQAKENKLTVPLSQLISTT